MTLSEAEMVAKVEGLLAAYSRGEFDRAAEMFDPEAEFERPGGQEIIKGRAAIRAWMTPDAFSEQTAEPLEFLREGDKLLSRTRVRSVGAGSGIEFEAIGWAVWTFTDTGLISRMQMVLDDDAEAAKGV